MLKDIKNSSLKVLIADDHPFFKAGLAGTLYKFDFVKEVKQAATTTEALHTLRDYECDLDFMDFQIPEINGPACIKKIKKHNPLIKVIAISMFEESNYVSEMIDSGANGYLAKTADERELHDAIFAVLGGRYFFSRELTGNFAMQIINRFKNLPGENENDLNEREREVLMLIYEEYSNKEIADKLLLAERSVERYRMQLLEKTNSKNVVGLVKWALRNGLVGDVGSK
jgi:DNA-binding NarL/FixJ family response regulator